VGPAIPTIPNPVASTAAFVTAPAHDTPKLLRIGLLNVSWLLPKLAELAVWFEQQEASIKNMDVLCLNEPVLGGTADIYPIENYDLTQVDYINTPTTVISNPHVPNAILTTHYYPQKSVALCLFLSYPCSSL
jgi:hypothetical protein